MKTKSPLPVANHPAPRRRGKLTASAGSISSAWARAARRGIEAAATPTALNPYAYGSQCWIIFNQSRADALAAKSAA